MNNINSNLYPKILDPKFDMSNPNDNILLFKGEFILSSEEGSIVINGEVNLKWFPIIDVEFTGMCKEHFNTFPTVLFLKEEIFIDINLLNYKYKEPIKLTGLRVDKSGCSVDGRLIPPIVLGDPNIMVKYVHFEIPNFKRLLAEPVKNDKSFTRSRIILDDGKYLINLDHVIKNKDESVETKLKEKGGYFFTYTGLLNRKDNKLIRYKESSNLLECLTYFLHFINGRRTSPFFRRGTKQDKDIWNEITPYLVDQYKSVYNWPINKSTKEFSTLWNKFRSIWDSDIERECLKSTLHWYVEANSNAAHLEGSIVLIQNALELLFHWIISEKLKYVNSTDAEKINAAAKISFLLSNFNITPSIPPELENLIQYSKRNSIINGPEALIRIRNCIVHPSINKRQTLKSVGHDTRIEVLHLGIWYVEVILLKYMHYKGWYLNRCKTFISGSISEEELE